MARRRMKRKPGLKTTSGDSLPPAALHYLRRLPAATLHYALPLAAAATATATACLPPPPAFPLSGSYGGGVAENGVSANVEENGDNEMKRRNVFNQSVAAAGYMKAEAENEMAAAPAVGERNLALAAAAA